MTDSNIIGYVAAFPIPEVIRGINAFTLGAQSVNPEVRVAVKWTSTWYGPGIERETADNLMNEGADIITIHQDSPAAMQAAQARGHYAIGYHSDMSAFAPEATLTSVVWDWTGLYKEVASNMADGAWEPEQIWSGLDKGVVDLAPISSKVPVDIRALVEQRRDAIVDKQLRIFEGPIRDENGDIRVPFRPGAVRRRSPDDGLLCPWREGRRSADNDHGIRQRRSQLNDETPLGRRARFIRALQFARRMSRCYAGWKR